MTGAMPVPAGAAWARQHLGLPDRRRLSGAVDRHQDGRAAGRQPQGLAFAFLADRHRGGGEGPEAPPCRAGVATWGGPFGRLELGHLLGREAQG